VGGIPMGAGGADSPTGSMLGRGSELENVYTMPSSMGHESGVNCLLISDDRIYSGGRDNSLFIWRAVPGPDNGLELVQDGQPLDMGSSVCAMCYDPATKWLFCGLWSGEINAFCKEPFMEDVLAGHRRSVSVLRVHSGVLISGSNDGTVRLWTRNPQNGKYQCFGDGLQNPSGAVTDAAVMNEALWIAAQNGITCFDLATMQPRGTIPSTHQVTGLRECSGYMIASFRNGDLKVYDGSGTETFNLPSRGEHTSNIAIEVMMHPIAGKPMLLCGQQYGFVTAYDLPDFRPRGSFVCRNNSDVKAIVDVKQGGLFITAGVHGDIMVWKWGQPDPNAAALGPGGAAPPQQQQQVRNPFASGAGAPQQQAPVAANPFASAPGFGGGGMMS